MRSSFAIVALAALTAFPATGAAQTTFRVQGDPRGSAPADGELAALRVEYAAAANAGDARRLSALYAPDAIAVPRDGVLLRGVGEIHRYSHEALSAAAGAATVTFTPTHVESNGVVASETGTFSETRADGASGATGVYVAIYARGADGAWRIAMEVRTRGRDQPAARW